MTREIQGCDFYAWIVWEHSYLSERGKSEMWKEHYFKHACGVRFVIFKHNAWLQRLFVLRMCTKSDSLGKDDNECCFTYIIIFFSHFIMNAVSLSRYNVHLKQGAETFRISCFWNVVCFCNKRHNLTDILTLHWPLAEWRKQICLFCKPVCARH